MKTNRALLSQMRWLFAQCVFSHTILEKAVARHRLYNAIITWAEVLLSGFSTFSAVVSLIYPANLWIILTAVAGGINMMIIVSGKKINFEKSAKEFEDFASKFLKLRNRLQDSLMEYKGELILQEATFAEYKKISKEYDDISAKAPRTSKGDYKKSQKALGLNGDGEEYTWNDAEIDRFLPNELA